MTTLLAIYGRPEGGEETTRAFEEAYATTHLPLIAETPGLRSIRVQAVTRRLMGEIDVLLVTAMGFDDWQALKDGLASDAMRRAGENLAEIAPGLTTLLVVEDRPDLVPEGW